MLIILKAFISWCFLLCKIFNLLCFAKEPPRFWLLRAHGSHSDSVVILALRSSVLWATHTSVPIFYITKSFFIFRDLETACTLLGSPNVPLNLGNSGYLSQDPAYEKSPLYTELNKSYRWFDKVNLMFIHNHKKFQCSFNI